MQQYCWLTVKKTKSQWALGFMLGNKTQSDKGMCHGKSFYLCGQLKNVNVQPMANRVGLQDVTLQLGVLIWYQEPTLYIILRIHKAMKASKDSREAHRTHHAISEMTTAPRRLSLRMFHSTQPWKSQSTRAAFPGCSRWKHAVHGALDNCCTYLDIRYNVVKLKRDTAS